MHGIQHLFRQHAIDKQTSTDSWHSAYSNDRSLSASNSNSDFKSSSSPWSQGKDPKTFSRAKNALKMPSLSDRLLDQLHTMSSSPQPVPNAAKSPSQEFQSLGSSLPNNRWKRSSPDPNKMMMMGRSQCLDINTKRVLSNTPSRKSNNFSERVGSPSLSGYPVRISF